MTNQEIKFDLAKVALTTCRHMTSESLTESIKNLYDWITEEPVQEPTWSNEDERIRKEIYENIRINNPKELSDKYIAWLEKQGEQKHVEWSDEDEKIANNLISQLSNLCTRKLIKEETKDKYVNWLKEHKN